MDVDALHNRGRLVGTRTHQQLQVWKSKTKKINGEHALYQTDVAHCQGTSGKIPHGAICGEVEKPG